MKIEDLHKHTTPLTRAMLQTLIMGQKKAEANAKYQSEKFDGTEIEADERSAFVNAITEANQTVLMIKAAFDFGYLAVYEDGPEFPKAERIELYQEIAEYMQLVRAGIESFVETHPIKFIEEEANAE